MVSTARYVPSRDYAIEISHIESLYTELLLGDRNYGPPVDMWGAGCIMAEMWTRSPIMQGNTEQQQIILISQLCGSFVPEVILI